MNVNIVSFLTKLLIACSKIMSKKYYFEMTCCLDLISWVCRRWVLLVYLYIRWSTTRSVWVCVPLSA